MRFVCSGLARAALLAAACGASAQSADHHYSSGLGFDFIYSKNWSGNLLGEFPLITAAELDARVRQNPQLRFSGCNQKIFFAKQGQPSSNLVVGAIPNECLGQAPDLDAFKIRIKAIVSKDNKPTALDEGEFRVDAQLFWVLRAKGVTARGSDPVTLEYVATVLQRGLVYWSLEAHSDAAIADFDRIAIKLSTGLATNLLPPATQLKAVAPPAPAPAAVTGTEAIVRDVLTPDPTASHHLESGLGFTYEVPEEFLLLNPKKVEAVRKFVIRQQEFTPEQAHTAACAEGLLAAENRTRTQIITVRAYRSECMGAPIDVDLLPRVGYASIAGLSQRATLSNVQTEATVLGEHPVWAMRASMVPTDHESSMRYMAMLLVPGPTGLAEFIFQAQCSACLEEMMATHIVFDDGAESPLFAQNFIHRSAAQR
jgi:hypothetical protein